MTSYLWKNVNGGNWGTSTNWSPIGVPGAADNATIPGTGTYSVVIATPASVHNLTVNDSNATIDDQTSITLYGTLSLPGEFILESGATLVGGVFNIDVADGGSFIASGGTLDGVSYNGLLELDGTNASLHVRHGIALKGIGGSGAGTVYLNGPGSLFYVDDTTTLDNAAVNIGNDNASASLYGLDTMGTGQVLTLGPHLNVVQVGKGAVITGSSNPGDGVVNQGTITAGLGGGQFAISSQSFTNQGSIGVSNGDLLHVASASFNNPGGVNVNGATLSIDGNWTSTGTINETNSTLNLGGIFTTATLNTVTRSGGTINVSGTLNNAGATLNVGTGTALGQLGLQSGGDVVGGTIVDAGGGFKLQGGGTLNDVTYDEEGLLQISGGNLLARALKIGAGGSLVGWGSIASNAAVTDNGSVEAKGGYLTLAGPITGTGGLTIDGGATLDMAGGSTTSSETTRFNGTGATLRLEAPSSFASPIANFAPSDRLALVGVNATSASTSGTTLTVQLSGGGSLVFTLATPPPPNESFIVSQESSGGTTTSFVNAVTGQTYSLTKTPTNITGTPYNDTFIATDGVLYSGDTLDGADGTDTLQLSGGGVFDLRAPIKLANIEVVSAQEGQPAYGTVASMVQTTYLRAGTSETVNVAPATINPSNPKPATITIIGNSNTDTINLATGNDVVTVGGIGETVHGGGGNNTFNVTGNTIGATIDGGTGRSSLAISGGGTMAMGANITRVVSATLGALAAGQSNYTFTANQIRGLAITDNSGGSTITLGAANQSVNVGPGGDRILATIGQVGGRILGGTTGSLLEITNGGTATLNSGTSNVTVQLDSSSKLTLSKMGFVTADGSSGNDTITALAAGQTLTGGSGVDSLIGYTGFGNTFRDTSAGLNGDSISNFGTGVGELNDSIDLTDMGFATAKLSYTGSSSQGTLTVDDGTHHAAITMIGSYVPSQFLLASDNNGGTQITLVQPVP